MTPEIRDCPERLTAMQRQVIHPHDIGLTIGLGAQQLREQLIAASANVVTGVPYARYHSFAKNETDIEVGFEVAVPVDLPGVEMSTLSAGREAVLTHHGAYIGIPKTFATLEQWVADNAVSREFPARSTFRTQTRSLWRNGAPRSSGRSSRGRNHRADQPSRTRSRRGLPGGERPESLDSCHSPDRPLLLRLPSTPIP